MSNDFKLPRELGLLASQLHEQQHFEAATLVIARLNASIEDLERVVHNEISELKAKLADAEAKIPKIIDGTALVVDCTSELNTEAVNATVTPAATEVVAASEIKPA